MARSLKQTEFKDVFKELPQQRDRTAPTIDTYFEIGIPQGFMPDQADRLSFYTALFSMNRIEEAGEIREELEDRFGKLPEDAFESAINKLVRKGLIEVDDQEIRLTSLGDLWRLNVCWEFSGPQNEKQ